MQSDSTFGPLDEAECALWVALYIALEYSGNMLLLYAPRVAMRSH